MSTSARIASPKISWRQRLFPNRHAVVWFLLYLATILAFLIWYELLPRLRVYQQLQGTWQMTTGKGHLEKALPAWWHIDGKQSRVYRQQGVADTTDWHVSKSTIRVRPSRDFFVVTRNYSFGKPGRSYDQEYIICVRDDRFFVINGIAQMDAAPDYLISLLRRANEIPANLQQQIESDK